MKIKNFWPVLLFTLACAIGLVIFAEALPAMALLQAPDATPSFVPWSLLRRMLPWMTGMQPVVTHDDLLKIFPFLVYHELSFILSVALSALATGAYLRVLGFPAGVCMAGGLAMAFSGYHFTLFNAGHRGYFIMMPYALFLFALVERVLTRPRWFHFALIAACAVAGLANQPDVFLLFMMLLAAYSVFRIGQIARDVGVKAYFEATWKRVLVGIVIMVVAFAGLGHNAIRHLVDVQIAGREKQIAAVTGIQSSTPDAPKKSEAELRKEKEELWIFATNWSLPPEDIAEFIAPCLRGLDTGNPKAPYWGRLGQSVNFASHADQPFDKLMQRGIYPNFRQHTLYLGAIPVALALFALLAACFGFLKPNPDASFVAGDVRRHWTGIAIFWGGAAVVALLLALGRHAPFYRLFYTLPMMDKIRAPVKFVHLIEFAVSVLFAFGLARLLRPVTASDERRFRRLGQVSVITLVIVAGICLARAVFVNSPALESAMKTVLKPLFSGWHVQAGPLTQMLVSLYRGAYMRAGWMLALAAAGIGSVAFAKPSARPTVSVAFCALLSVATVLDTAEVGSRFVVVNDISGKYASNPIATAIKAKGKPDGLAFSYLQLTNQPLPSNLPFLETLVYEGVYCLDPTTPEAPESLRVKTLLTFKDDLTKRWKYWGATAVMTSPDQAREMTRAKLVKVVALYDLDPAGRLVTPQDPRKAQVAVSEPLDRIPPVAVFYGWRAVDSEAAAIERIAQPDFDQDREIAVTGAGLVDTPATSSPTPGNWIVAPSETRGSKAVVKAVAEKPGMLFVRENLLRTVALSATVNGKRTPIYKANGAFIAIPVEAGESTVVIRPALSALRLAATAAAVTFVLFCLIGYVREPSPAHV